MSWSYTNDETIASVDSASLDGETGQHDLSDMQGFFLLLVKY